MDRRLRVTGGTMITRRIGKGSIRKSSAKVKRPARVREAKAPPNRSDLLLAEKPILRTLRRIRSKGRIERVFG